MRASASSFVRRLICLRVVIAPQNLVLLPQVIIFQGQVATEQLLDLCDQRIG
jgi:hypothetical protein